MRGEKPVTKRLPLIRRKGNTANTHLPFTDRASKVAQTLPEAERLLRTPPAKNSAYRPGQNPAQPRTDRTHRGEEAAEQRQEDAQPSGLHAEDTALRRAPSAPFRASALRCAPGRALPLRASTEREKETERGTETAPRGSAPHRTAPPPPAASCAGRGRSASLPPQVPALLEGESPPPLIHLFIYLFIFLSFFSSCFPLSPSFPRFLPPPFFFPPLVFTFFLSRLFFHFSLFSSFSLSPTFHSFPPLSTFHRFLLFPPFSPPLFLPSRLFLLPLPFFSHFPSYLYFPPVPIFLFLFSILSFWLLSPLFSSSIPFLHFIFTQFLHF